MTRDRIDTAKSSTQEYPTYEGHAYYKDEDSISTMNIVGDG